MLKLTAVLSLMLIGSTLWAASLSCDSCGSECAAACGTRHFRSCCFNYLRRKRVPQTVKIVAQNPRDSKPDQQRTVYVVENVPDFWIPSVVSSDLRMDDNFDNRLQMYDM